MEDFLFHFLLFCALFSNQTKNENKITLLKDRSQSYDQSYLQTVNVIRDIFVIQQIANMEIYIKPWIETE